MKEELKIYVDTLFKDAPQNDAALDLKDEIISNLNARYDDCIRQGMSETEAYGSAIKSVGDISGLIEELKNKQVTVNTFNMSANYFEGDEGPGFFNSADDSGMNKFFSHITPENEKTILGTATTILWVATVIVYFLISYLFHSWKLSWLIFLVSSCANIVIDLLFSLNRLRREPYTAKIHNKCLKKIEGAASSLLWISLVIVYMIISFATQFWNVTWIIFLFGVIAQVIMDAFFKLSRRK